MLFSRYLSRILATAGLLLCVMTGTVRGDEQTSEVDELKTALAELRRDYESRLRALEERILELEEIDRRAAGDDELAELRAAAEAAATASEPRTTADADPPEARQLALNRLNPEISATGIVAGVASDVEREEFQRGEFELDLQAALDPYSKMRWTIAFTEEGEVEVEEGYLTWTALPGGLDLTAGKFRQRFGSLNRQHVHALPQTSYPLVIQSFFGEEGLGQVGLSATWLLPRPWASANEVSLELTDGQNDFFGGEDFDDLALLARIKNYWDLSSSAYFEWGLTGMTGRTAQGGDARVFGTDFTYHWQPPSRAKYREITWRTELLYAERENDPGVTTDALGAYTYVEGLAARNLYLGARFDWSEDPFDPLAESWAVAPYVTWWQSEWVRLRGEYQYREDELTGESENRFTLQLTWAAGPHKHETY